MASPQSTLETIVCLRHWQWIFSWQDEINIIYFLHFMLSFLQQILFSSWHNLSCQHDYFESPTAVSAKRQSLSLMGSLLGGKLGGATGVFLFFVHKHQRFLRTVAISPSKEAKSVITIQRCIPPRKRPLRKMWSRACVGCDLGRHGLGKILRTWGSPFLS